jgi:ribosomal protein L11 methyltransferase
VPADGPAAWCVQVDLEREAVDEVSGRLWAAGVGSVQEIDLDDGGCRLVAGTTEDRAPEVVAAVGDRGRVTSYAAAYDGWLDAWRPFARPVRVGRLVVHPAWEEPTLSAGDVAIAVDAQRAFGQGNHPTTRLVLAELDRTIQPGDRVLDVGCGSGILSVAAARLGAVSVAAVDIEPEAVAATTANARRNDVEAQISVSATPVGDLVDRFDVVLANILAPILVELAPAIAARVRPDGCLLVSGLLVEQRDAVVAAHPGFTAAAETTLDGWLALTLRR